ncbi:MAG: Fe-S cluster assembly protein SufD [Gaiellales bacterium]|jgi:Fe-S cluster assembly protein SufD|nr:Fe-S cluster assembly protein SufD [Gaiellales bacterium]
MTQTVSEPAWLTGQRASARERYEALPVPTNREEAWRYTNLRGFDPDVFELQPAALTLSEVELPDGVVFGNLARLAAERPELVERHYGTVVSAQEKFAAGNAAAWTDGVLLYVPAGVELEVPLRASVELPAEGAGIHHRTLVVLEAGARATFAEDYSSTVAGYVNTVVELVVGDGARLEYVTTQRHHPQTRQFGTHRATIGRDGEVDWVVLGLGGTRAKSRIESYLAAPGANAKVTGAYFLTGSEHADYDTTQEHAAPNTTSDLFFKGVLDDQSRAVWRGVIRVDKGAQKTDAYQENRNLLLSHDARADSIPGLEIEANDVRCTHGATIGQIDKLQLFYLMSRGLSRPEAERMIVRGFFQPILDRIDSDEVRDSLAAELEARMASGSAR